MLFFLSVFLLSCHIIVICHSFYTTLSDAYLILLHSSSYNTSIIENIRDIWRKKLQKESYKLEKINSKK